MTKFKSKSSFQGGRGGRRGGGSSRGGPMLPGKLLREMGVEGGGSFRGNRGRRRGGQRDRSRGTKRESATGRAIPETTKNSGKKRKTSPPADRGQTKLNDASQQREEDPEAVIQRRLAKQLGMKTDKLKKGEDGLDDLLEELDDIMMGGGGSSGSDDDGDMMDCIDSEESGGREEASPSSSAGFDSGSPSLSLSYSSKGDDNDESDDDDVTEEEAPQMAAPTSTAGTKYIPPALRRAQQEQSASDKAETEVLRKVRGLVNRMTESNLEGIVGDLTVMYKNEGRSFVSTSLSKELITSSTEGPRASERFAITAAASVASLAALTESSEIIATFLSMLGRQLEASLKGRDTLACSNLVRLLACLYLSKAIKSDLMFDVLDAWSDPSSAFTDEHVVSIAGLLTVAGLALRKAEPALMKNFVVEIHEKASRVVGDQLTTRARVMLDLVVDVKNNRMKDRKGMLAISAHSSATLANALPPNVGQWFRGTISKIEAVAVGGIPWRKVVSGENKGFWWLQGINDSSREHLKKNEQNKPYGQDEDTNNDTNLAHLLKLAQKLHMSTDTRRAIFLAVMSSEDATDAAEKLLRLNLKGSQEREIVRVTVECCMHEPAWNPYYGLLLTRLCTLAKGHRVTLNYCLWDFIKDLSSSGGGSRSHNKLRNGRQIAIFSRLCAYAVTSKALPLASVIKVQGDFDAHDMDAKELLMWKTFFKSVCGLPRTNEDMKDIFSRLGEAKEYKALKKNCREFLKYQVGPWLVDKGEDGVALRCTLAEKCLR